VPRLYSVSEARTSRLLATRNRTWHFSAADEKDIKAGTVTPSDLLTQETIDAMKAEVLLRWKQLEYALDSDHVDGTASAVVLCSKIDSDLLQNQLKSVRSTKGKSIEEVKKIRKLNDKISKLEGSSKDTVSPNKSHTGGK
jgi:hypothetical protein